MTQSVPLAQVINNNSARDSILIKHISVLYYTIRDID